VGYVEQAVDEASPIPLVDTAERGFNANMYESFAELMEATTAAAVTFDFSFSPSWPTSLDLDVTVPLAVSAAAIPLMREAATVLRRTEEPQPFTIRGLVFGLESSGNPSDLLHPVGSREITIQAENLG